MVSNVQRYSFTYTVFRMEHCHYTSYSTVVLNVPATQSEQPSEAMHTDNTQAQLAEERQCSQRQHAHQEKYYYKETQLKSLPAPPRHQGPLCIHQDCLWIVTLWTEHKLPDEGIQELLQFGPLVCTIDNVAACLVQLSLGTQLKSKEFAGI